MEETIRNLSLVITLASFVFLVIKREKVALVKNGIVETTLITLFLTCAFINLINMLVNLSSAKNPFYIQQLVYVLMAVIFIYKAIRVHVLSKTVEKF